MRFRRPLSDRARIQRGKSRSDGKRRAYCTALRSCVKRRQCPSLPWIFRSAEVPQRAFARAKLAAWSSAALRLRNSSPTPLESTHQKPDAEGSSETS